MFAKQIAFFFLLLFLFPSCVYKVVPRARYAHCPLFIEMPHNQLVFENISSLVYSALCNHHARVGYRLVSHPTNAYVLKTTIKDLKSTSKFLSPDVLTYAVIMNLVLSCELFDKTGTSIAKRTFNFSTFIFKPKKYVENEMFNRFEYKRLLESNIFKIEQYFRRFYRCD